MVETTTPLLSAPAPHDPEPDKETTSEGDHNPLPSPPPWWAHLTATFLFSIAWCGLVTLVYNKAVHAWFGWDGLDPVTVWGPAFCSCLVQGYVQRNWTCQKCKRLRIRRLENWRGHCVCGRPGDEEAKPVLSHPGDPPGPFPE